MLNVFEDCAARTTISIPLQQILHDSLWGRPGFDVGRKAVGGIPRVRVPRKSN
jgi:hypothetical protein